MHWINWPSKLLILIASLVIFACGEIPAPLTRVYLHDNWQFKGTDTLNWQPAKVPGVIHTDLMAQQLIPHPWKGMNETKVQWIENKNWEYLTHFNLNETDQDRQTDLVFEGLDTYASIYLNDSLILEADNMFRSWRINVSEIVKPTDNQLRIVFESPIRKNIDQIEALPYQLPASSESVETKVSPFTRKAPYHFGWDWGPRLVTSGIWRPVYLEMYDHARIADYQLYQKDLSDSLARIVASVKIQVEKPGNYQLNVYNQITTTYLEKGERVLNLTFEIENPRKWWPNGWGEPYLYEIPVELTSQKVIIDQEVRKIGLRTIELIQEEDSIGESFYFLVNGHKLFARGANYIPQSHFLPSITDHHYRSLINKAVSANINMLRVWGGGIYEDDFFYDLCDEKGILIWQDFMFANTMYPGDSAFVHNVSKEIEDNVLRLRNHPSIALWNGNNEIEVAWKNWGWQQVFNYSAADSTKIWNDYVSLFQQKIPEMVSALDDRPYTSTSPLSNWGKLENFNYGSMHYWGVWHGKDQFEDYYKYVGRFMSEYGFQSFPDMETIAWFADSSNWNLNSPVMAHHQKSYVGNGLINEQINKYYGKPTDFEDFVEKSQQTQAKAMQMAIDAHRINKGHCWGSLFWQFNDCWPGPSWSSIDVFGREKELYKQLSTLFSPVAVIPNTEDGKFKLILINDTLEDWEGTLIIKRKGKSEVSTKIPVTIKSNSIKSLDAELLADFQKNTGPILLQLVKADRIVLERSLMPYK